MTEGTNRADLPPDRITTLWRRVKHHRIAQWTVGYVAVAYGIQHAITLTSEAFKWPDAVIRISMLLLALGLPLAMTLAWYHGERVSRRISAGEMAIVSVMLVGISFAFYLFIRPEADIASPAPAAQEASATAVRQGSANPHGAISVAVLPFVNLSSDKEQEFFSDGMTEEITAALAQVKGLHVVGRTSAFAFKNKNEDLRAIGKSLGATHLIEGSVRKAGNQLRITAQLIKADDDSHLWAQNYDRELKDVFAVQEDIAQAIAASLRVPLGLKQGQSLVPSRTANLESYQDYLRARALVRTRGPREPGGPLTQATKLLEQVVARDPDYAPAWGLLGQTYDLLYLFTPAFFSASVEETRRFLEVSVPKAENAARRAIRLDPTIADAYVALALAQAVSGKFIQMEDLFKQALSLDPGNPEALQVYSIQLAYAGRLKDSLALRQRLQELEPFVPVFNAFTAEVLWLNGQNGAAIAMLKALPPDFIYSAYFLAENYAAAGRYGEAAGALFMIPGGFLDPGTVETAARLLRSAPARAAAPQTLPRLGVLSFAFLYVGAPERALEPLDDAPGLSQAAISLWLPSAAGLRKTQRFKTLMRKLGLVDYWRARGWPDLCHATTGEDFVCN